jgi:hypothetical protein
MLKEFKQFIAKKCGRNGRWSDHGPLFWSYRKVFC